MLWIALVPMTAHAEEPRRLVEAWKAFWTRATAKGMNLEVVNTNDFLANVHGGLRQGGAVLGDLDLLLTIDTENLLGWTGGTVFLYGLGLYGPNPSGFVGDVQGVSNIAGPNIWTLFEAWYQHNFLDERLSALVGLYDVTSEFDVIRASSEFFVNSSFGTGPEFSFSGRNGISTFPTSALGLRLEAKLTEAFHVRATVGDGVPGDPGNAGANQVILRSEDGLFVDVEAAYYRFAQTETDVGPPSGLTSVPRRRLLRRLGRAAPILYDTKIAIGVFSSTTEVSDLSETTSAGTPVTRDGTYGVYGLVEHTVFKETHDPRQDLVLFARAGMADPRVNRFGSFFSGGLVRRGLIPGRDEDETGFAIAVARNSSHYEAAQLQMGAPVAGEAIVLEFSHGFYIPPGIILQPDFQYIINPGTDPTIPNALVIGARLELHPDIFR